MSILVLVTYEIEIKTRTKQQMNMRERIWAYNVKLHAALHKTPYCNYFIDNIKNQVV